MVGKLIVIGVSVKDIIEELHSCGLEPEEIEKSFTIKDDKILVEDIRNTRDWFARYLPHAKLIRQKHI